MRISTAQIFTSGTLNMNRTQTDLFKLQNQIATGRRILSPEDDPVAAAQALVTTQSQEVNQQYLENQQNAKVQLTMAETELSGVTDVLQYIRERAIQLGNGALGDTQRGYIAADLQRKYDELVSLANSQNGEGLYLFSGFRGATRPFSASGNTSGPFDINNPTVVYNGDEGERRLQVDASRQMGVTVSGEEAFLNIRNGNGTFTTTAATGNAGTGFAAPGLVTDLAAWNALTQPQDLQLQFTVAGPLTTYQVVDVAGGNTVIASGTYAPGQAIDVPAAGIQLSVSGQPGNGDSFAVAPAVNESVFDIVQNLIGIAQQPAASWPGGGAEYAQNLAQSISHLDRGMENILRVRATVGSRLNELDSLETVATDLDVQFAGRVSKLQDLDYAEAISSLNLKQIQLEAAQRSFVKVSGLSLFNFL